MPRSQVTPKPAPAGAGLDWVAVVVTEIFDRVRPYGAAAMWWSSPFAKTSKPAGVYLKVVPEGRVSVCQPDAESWKSSENRTTPGVADGDADAIAVLALGTGVEPPEPMSAYAPMPPTTTSRMTTTITPMTAARDPPPDGGLADGAPDIGAGPDGVQPGPADGVGPGGGGDTGV